MTLCELLTAEKVQPLDMLDENVYFASPSVNDHDMTFYPDSFETLTAPEVEISQEQPTVESIEPPSPSNPNKCQSYLPYTLRNLKPTLTIAESQDAHEPSVKTQPQLLKTPKSKKATQKKSEATCKRQTAKISRKGEHSTASTAKG
ncbi:hypothetical protein DPMN_112795 [Dreissena polymorpha]|uniref:Uncharacterized protein n=1 Tax=Dreissena polymorpha TaxID=45954 RepID=A0A9D4KHS8_DREPO|nr:hypothetical protein DPMN_112795 [Dreissena polymorpha]